LNYQPPTDTLLDDVAGRHGFDGLESVHRWVKHPVLVKICDRNFILGGFFIFIFRRRGE